MSDTNMSKDKSSSKPAAFDQAAGAVPPFAAAGAEAAAKMEVEDDVLPEEFMSETERRSRAIVQSYVGWASAAGLLPVPVLDVSAVLGIQIAMLKSVAAVYGVPFNRRMVKPLLVSLVNAGSAYMLAAPAAKRAGIPFLTLEDLHHQVCQEDNVLLLIDCGSRLVATASLILTDDNCYLETFVVDRPFWGRGMSDALGRELTRLAHERGCRTLNGLAAKTNTAIQSLGRRFGWEPVYEMTRLRRWWP